MVKIDAPDFAFSSSFHILLADPQGLEITSKTVSLKCRKETGRPLLFSNCFTFIHFFYLSESRRFFPLLFLGLPLPPSPVYPGKLYPPHVPYKNSLSYPAPSVSLQVVSSPPPV